MAKSDPELYRDALKMLIDDNDIDCVMMIYAHSGFHPPPPEPARAVIDTLKEKYPKPVVACWMGGEEVNTVRQDVPQEPGAVLPCPREGCGSPVVADKI